MKTKYYAKKGWEGHGWFLMQRDSHGDRTLARNMGEATCRRVARLLNKDEDVNKSYPEFERY